MLPARPPATSCAFGPLCLPPFARTAAFRSLTAGVACGHVLKGGLPGSAQWGPKSHGPDAGPSQERNQRAFRTRFAMKRRGR